MIQTSAAISPGSSGGPLLTLDGTVVGVTTASWIDGQNLNLAVPAGSVGRLLRNAGNVMPLASTWSAPDADPNSTFRAFRAAIAGGRYAEAEEDLRRVVHVRPDYALAHLYLGDTLGLEGRHAEALDEFRQAARLRPLDAQAYIGGAIASDALGDATKAFQLLRKAAQLDRNNSAPHSLMGRMYFNAREYGPSVDEYDRAVRLGDSNVETALRLGDGHYNLGEYRDAKAAYERAVNLSPQNAYAHLWVGWACYQLKDYNGAAAAWTQAAQLDPGGQIGNFARQNLRSLDTGQ